MLKELKASQFLLWQNLVSGIRWILLVWELVLIISEEPRVLWERICWWLCSHQQLVLWGRSKTVMPITKCWFWRPNVHMNVFLRCWTSSGLVPYAPLGAWVPGVCSWRAALELVTPWRNLVSGLQGSTVFYWESCWSEKQIGVDTAVKCLVLSLE